MSNKKHDAYPPRKPVSSLLASDGVYVEGGRVYTHGFPESDEVLLLAILQALMNIESHLADLRDDLALHSAEASGDATLALAILERSKQRKAQAEGEGT